VLCVETLLHTWKFFLVAIALPYAFYNCSVFSFCSPASTQLQILEVLMSWGWCCQGWWYGCAGGERSWAVGSGLHPVRQRSTSDGMCYVPLSRTQHEWPRHQVWLHTLFLLLFADLWRTWQSLVVTLAVSRIIVWIRQCLLGQLMSVSVVTGAGKRFRKCVRNVTQ